MMRLLTTGTIVASLAVITAIVLLAAGAGCTPHHGANSGGPDQQQQARAQADSDWIKQRERMWAQVRSECGGDHIPAVGGVDDLEQKLVACREAKALGRIPGQIGIGDTVEYVRVQWGKPERTEDMLSEYGVAEWWWYSGRAVHFENGRVETIHSSR